jgi:hypothetical protein
MHPAAPRTTVTDFSARAADRGSATDWAARRAPASPEDLVLTDAAKVWLAALPDTVRPTALAARYPRIANRLAVLWHKPVQANAYFDDLLIDKRGGRQGFPLPVVMELASLKAYYQSEVYPLPSDIWSDSAYWR